MQLLVMENTQQQKDPIEILIAGIDKGMSDATFETVMNAVHYLRTGRYRFNRNK